MYLHVCVDFNIFLLLVIYHACSNDDRRVISCAHKCIMTSNEHILCQAQAHVRLNLIITFKTQDQNLTWLRIRLG